jgi:hypothetical protein
MDLYTFKVDKVKISHTRAIHEDTLHLVYTAYVDGDVVAQSLLSLGDFNDGEFVPGDHVPDAQKGGLARVVINDPTSKIAFNFQLLNAGNVPAGALTGRVSATADQLAGIGAGLAGVGVAEGTGALAVASGPLFLGAIALEAFATLYSWLNTDCDGPVAVDQISGPRYALDAWADTPSQIIQVDQRPYPGVESPTGCGSNSHYNVSWSLRHWRTWAQVADEAQPAVPLIAEAGVSAAAHNGALHAFGVDEAGNLLSARGFTGATWSLHKIGVFGLSSLPVSAVSFNDRLYVLGIQSDGNITTLAYTSDGGSWTLFASGPNGLDTDIGIATAVFRHRLYVIARDSSSKRLRLTSSDDLVTWDPWADIPDSGLPPVSVIAAASLGDVLHIFALHLVATDVHTLLHNSTPDGSTWTGWREVERGTRLQGAGLLLDVAAGVFQDRIYIASRWDKVQEGDIGFEDIIAVNFSQDGDNWSGWRIPPSSEVRSAGATAALAPVGNHMYIFAPELVASSVDGHTVWVY